MHARLVSELVASDKLGNVAELQQTTGQTGAGLVRQFSGFLGAQQQSVNSLILLAFLKTD